MSRDGYPLRLQTALLVKENVKSAELELDPEDVAYMRELAEEIDK